MRMPIPIAALFMLCALPAGGRAAPAASPEVPAPLKEAAECMAIILRVAPGVMAVEIQVMEGNGKPFPVLQYRYLDRFGGRRYTEVSLFAIEGAQEPFVFDWADVDGDPAAAKALPLWQRRCHAAGGYITSVP